MNETTTERVADKANIAAEMKMMTTTTTTVITTTTAVEIEVIFDADGVEITIMTRDRALLFGIAIWPHAS